VRSPTIGTLKPETRICDRPGSAGTSGDSEIRRYHVSSNPNVADAASATLIITLDQPSFNNHKRWR
jgi:hypothetical protein